MFSTAAMVMGIVSGSVNAAKKVTASISLRGGRQAGRRSACPDLKK